MHNKAKYPNHPLLARLLHCAITIIHLFKQKELSLTANFILVHSVYSSSTIRTILLMMSDRQKDRQTDRWCS